MVEKPCLDAETAAAFAEGTLAMERSADVEAHIDRCAECRRWVSALAAAAPTASGEGSSPATETRGTFGSRYHVVARLGAGGMGVVYRVYDGQLERHVAVKLLRGGAEHRERLLREARALAKLQHPAVVAVHDVGEWDGQLYLAMELVAGTTLRRWLEGASRTPSEIVARFVAAGRGLAAAHAAGLVHRDFKPENVLCSDDGRVCVADFGLARDEREVPEDRAGTPAYMAPEQHRGDAADARSDQYSFCVALREALPPRGRWQRVLARGLALDPVRRWPSMTALLEALTHPAWYARRSLIAAGGGLALVVAGATVVAARSPNAPPPCGPPAAIWGEPTRSLTRARFLGSGFAHTAAAWPQIDAALAAWSDHFVEAHLGVCEATHLRGEQSAELLDRRMACLDARRATVDAFVGLLGRAPDAALVARAPLAAAELPVLGECTDGALVAIPSPPSASGPRLAELRRVLAVVEAETLAGRFVQARAQLAPLVAHLPADEYRPVVAEVRDLEGRVLDGLGDVTGAVRAFLDASAAAQASHHDAIAARALATLVYLVGVRQAKPAEAEQLLPLATAAIDRIGAPRDLRARMLRYTADLRGRQGRYREAVDRGREALALLEGGDRREAARTLDVIGMNLESLGELDAARDHYQRALAAREGLLGPVHPELAYSLENLAIAACRRGDCAGGLPLIERALALVERTLGPRSLRAGQLLGTLGNIQRAADDAAAAIASYRRAIAIAVDTLGPTHTDVAMHQSNLAPLLRARGDLDAAQQLYESALAIKRASYGDEHPSVATTRTNLGVLLQERGQFAAALAHHEAALAINRIRRGEEHPNTGLAHIGVAIALRSLGRQREALPHAMAALAIAERDPLHQGIDTTRDELAAIRRALR